MSWASAMLRDARWVRPAAAFVAMVYLWWLVWSGLFVTGAHLAGHQTVLVTSGSMAPALQAGDLVVNGQPSDDAMTLNRIVTFERSDGQLVTHRIRSVNDDGTFWTRGDANRANDRPAITAADVAGVGRALVPAGGMPLLWARQGQWLSAFLWLAGTGAALWFAFSGNRSVRPRPGVRAWAA